MAMSFPIVLGSKSVSARTLIGIHDVQQNQEEQYQYFADDGITGLVSVQIPGSVPLTATAVCPQREWQAFVTIEYFDMLLVVDNSEDEEDDWLEIQTTTSSGGRRRLARHSTVAEVRIQISPLSLPYSSAYRNILHRLTLPRTSAFQNGYLDEDDLEGMLGGDQSPVQLCLVFSSDRRRLACLIPHLRGPQSALVAFDLKRPKKELTPRPRPKLPSYIPRPSSEPKPPIVPEARDEPQWLALPTGGTALDIQHTADYWLHNITSICNCSTQTSGKGSSVLLAGCRDGSILGISFQPLLLAGRLYHPPGHNASRQTITHLSHIATNPTNKTNGEALSKENGDGSVVGRLVALQAQGKAILFKTRMILSSLAAAQEPTADLEEDSSSRYNPEDSTSNLNLSSTDLDGTEFSRTPTNAIHAESFNVVKTGRRHSLPASSRLAEEAQPLLGRHHPLSPSKFRQHNNNSPMGNTGLLMFLEPLDEYPGQYCRAQWISRVLLALLEAPTKRKEEESNNHSRNRVAQVIGVLPNRKPEVLTELTLTSGDLQEHAHTAFSLNDDYDDDDNRLQLDSTTRPKALLAGKATDVLEATLAIQHDPYSGCLAISSARIMDACTPKATTSRKGSKVCVFVCLWNWRSNVLGFTAMATCASPQRPISRLLFAKERATNVRQLAHLRSAGGTVDWIRKDMYPVGTLSPSQDARSSCGSEVHVASPLLLTSTSVTFALASQPSNKTSEVEWQECAIPVSYRLEYGSPSIAAISSSGQSIAVASSRGLCVLECTPRAKKFSVGKERGHLLEETQQTSSEEGGALNRRGYMLPPKWHFFGNETEEKAFRVLAMTWWRGNADSKRSHASDDLLVAVIQTQRQADKNADPPGTCYLACWSQRRLDAAHQRLRPIDDNLRSSRSQWGVRLPHTMQPKSLDLLEQPTSIPGSQQERKAVVLLTFAADPTAAVEFLVFQFQAIQSVGRTQSSESYQEHHPFSVLSRQRSSGQIDNTVDRSSISSVFLATASFQFDLRRHRNRFSVSNPLKSGEAETIEIVGTLGVVRTPGCGLDAVVITSSGPSGFASILNSEGLGCTLLQTKMEMKSSEISSYWLSDLILGQRAFSTDFGGEDAKMDFFVWTFQLVSGKVFSWFVPCFEYVRTGSRNDGLTPNAFCNRIMLGLVCPVGGSTTWLLPSPAKTGRDFMIGCMPNSAHGVVLCTGQASRKFHRSIAGDFDHSLFAADFLEHEFLYPRDFELSPPAFISSLAALIRSEAFLASGSDTSVEQNPRRCPVNAGGDDIEKAVKAVDARAHTQIRSKRHQDAAFMALRLLLLRSTEQLTDDLRKHKAPSPNDKPVTSSILAEVLRIIQSCSSSRLQFASLLLEVGRQLEPSCFPNLFPLPTPIQHESHINGGAVPSASSSNNLQTVNDVFRACLEDGSLLCSVSSLPIISGSSLSRENSMLLLDHCLGVYRRNSDVESDFFFDFSTEERCMLRDIFRFGAKLEDCGKESIVNLPSEEQEEEEAASIVSSSDSSHSSGDDVDEYSSRREGISLACGMINLSWFRSKPNPSQQNLGVQRKAERRERKKLLEAQNRVDKSGESKDTMKEAQEDSANIGNVARSVALLLVSLVIPNNEQQLVRSYSWKRSSALALLLLGQEESLLPKLSAIDCTNLAKSAVAMDGGGQLQESKVEDGITALLINCMIACSSEIGSVSAGKLLDLVLVILERTGGSSDLDTTLPGLLVVGITAGHVCGRVNEILDTENQSIPFSRCYLAAREKAVSLKSNKKGQG